MLAVKNLAATAGDIKRHRLDPWVRKVPRRKAWQPTPVFLPGESQGTEEPGRLQSIGSQRVGNNWGNLAQHSTLPSWFSHSVMSDSLHPHGLQHTRPPCLSQTPGAYSNSRPLNQWFHTTISSFSSHLQSFPESGSFPRSQFFVSVGQKYWSFSFSISPSNEYSGLISFRMDWLDLLAVQGTRKSLLQHHSSKASILQCSAFFVVQLSHPYMTTGKTIALTRWTFVGKVMPLLFNMLSRLVIAFLSRSKRLLISWLQSPSAMILKPKKIKSLTVSIVSPSICHEVMGLDAMILVFWMLSVKPAFSLSSFTFIKRLFSSSSLSAIRVVSSAYLRLLIFLPAILIPACASSSLGFLMMCSAYKLNKQVTIYSLDILLSQFGTSLLFHVQF